jgi:hypothetical protein
MSSSPRGARPASGTTKQGGGPKSATPRLNRAQLQAMEIRKAATVIEQEHGGSGTAFVEVGAVAPARRAGSSRLIKKQIAKPVLLTKAEEMRYVRADLKRLAITASALFAVMIVLLFIVEG